MNVCDECGSQVCDRAIDYDAPCTDPEGTLADSEEQSRSDLDQYHIVPVNDLREHEASPDCFCKPLRDEEEPTVWIHNSLDQRESFESGKRLKA